MSRKQKCAKGLHVYPVVKTVNTPMLGRHKIEIQERDKICIYCGFKKPIK